MIETEKADNHPAFLQLLDKIRAAGGKIVNTGWDGVSYTVQVRYGPDDGTETR